jgi:hypothetical protein
MVDYSIPEWEQLLVVFFHSQYMYHPAWMCVSNGLRVCGHQDTPEMQSRRPALLIIGCGNLAEYMMFRASPTKLAVSRRHANMCAAQWGLTRTPPGVS